MARRVHLRLLARIDGRAQPTTVTIDRDRGLIAVRPLRRRRTFELPLERVVSGVYYDVIKAELAVKRRAKAEARKGRR